MRFGLKDFEEFNLVKLDHVLVDVYLHELERPDNQDV